MLADSPCGAVSLPAPCAPADVRPCRCSPSFSSPIPSNVQLKTPQIPPYSQPSLKLPSNADSQVYCCDAERRRAVRGASSALRRRCVRCGQPPAATVSTSPLTQNDRAKLFGVVHMHPFLPLSAHVCVPAPINFHHGQTALTLSLGRALLDTHLHPPHQSHAPLSRPSTAPGRPSCPTRRAARRALTPR
jgi:hypothetical protein